MRDAHWASFPVTASSRYAVFSMLVPMVCFATWLAQALAATPVIVKSEFLFDTAPFASAHASTIVETSRGLIAAWFGGTREGADDVGIWVTRDVNGRWEQPVEVATGRQADGTRYPCWNPVLFE